MSESIGMMDSFSMIIVIESWASWHIYFTLVSLQAMDTTTDGSDPNFIWWEEIAMFRTSSPHCHLLLWRLSWHNRLSSCDSWYNVSRSSNNTVEIITRTSCQWLVTRTSWALSHCCLVRWRTTRCGCLAPCHWVKIHSSHSSLSWCKKG